MTKIQKFSLGIIFTFFSINLLGCSDSETKVSDGPPTPPTIQVSLADNFNFGTVTQGNTALPIEVVIKNSGSESLVISDLFLSKKDNFDLNLMGGNNPCTTTMPRLFTGESCTIEVSFVPVQFNPPDTNIKIDTVLQIDSNDPASPKVINLAGISEQVSNALTVTINQVETTTCPDVVAYVSVTDQSDFPVKDLELLPAAFTIEEDGASVVAPRSSTVVTEPISIALVMDNSSSMSDDDITKMSQEANDIINQLNFTDQVTDQAEIIKFDKAIFLKVPFTDNAIDLKTAINELPPIDRKGTALYDTLLVAITDTAKMSGRKAIIVITDGDNSVETTTTVAEITNNAEAEGIPIFVIALGSFSENILAVLRPIADDTSGAFYEADAIENIGTIIKQKLTAVLFEDQYKLEYTSGISGGPDVKLTINVSDSEGHSGADDKLIPSCPL